MNRFVKVTACLATPIGLSPTGNPTYLDSLVELRSLQLSKPISEGGRHAQRMEREEDIDTPGQVWTPFRSTLVDGVPIPHCSAGIYCGPEQVDRIAKRFASEKCLQLNAKERTKVNTTGGEFKSCYLPHRTAITDRVVWFGSLRGGPQSKPSRLKRLLKPLATIGHKANHGYGRVIRWEVEQIEDDYSWFAPSDGGPVLMRPLPLTEVPDDAVGWRRTFGGFVPPYWHKTFWKEIAVPC